jgi:hypothetical protein
MNEGGRAMSQVSREVLTRGILGISAVSLMFGAVQIASGRDLGEVSRVSASQISLASAGISINRAA